MALEYSDVKNRIAIAKRFYERKRKSQIKTWNDLYAGRHYDSSISEADRIAVNYTFATLTEKNSKLYYRNPKAVITPRKVAFEPQAHNNELILEWQMREQNVKQEVKLSLLDEDRFGYGTLFTGWKTVGSKAKTIRKGERRKKLLGLPVGPRESYEEVVTDEDSFALEDDRIDIKRWDPTKIYFSPESTYNNIPYVVLEHAELFTSVKEDERFPKALRDQLPNGTFIEKDYMEAIDGEHDDQRRITLYDYYDAENWYICADGLDEPLLKEPNPYAAIFGKQNPLPVLLKLGPHDNDGFYPLSEVGLIESQQRELNKIRSQQINHRKRFNRRYLAMKDVITAEDLEKLTSAEDGAVITIDTKGETIDKVIMPIQDATLQYPFEVEPRIIDDINVITGIGQYRLGSTQGQAKTLGQTQLAEAATQSRAEDEQAAVDDFAKQLYRRMVQLNQKFLQDEVALRIVDDSTGSVEYRVLNNADIQGEFDYDVESGSSQKKDDDVERKQALDFYNLVGQDPMFASIRKDIVQAIVETFPTMGGKLKELIQKAEPPPAPPPDTNESMSFPVDKMFPLLSDPVRTQILEKYGIQYVPIEQLPIEGPLPPQLEGGEGGESLTGPVEPSMMPGREDGAPSASDLSNGARQL